MERPQIVPFNEIFEKTHVENIAGAYFAQKAGMNPTREDITFTMGFNPIVLLDHLKERSATMNDSEILATANLITNASAIGPELISRDEHLTILSLISNMMKRSIELAVQKKV